jgi:hypothetical protein
MSSAVVSTTFGLEIISSADNPPRRSLRTIRPFLYQLKEVPNEQQAEMLGGGRSFVVYSDPRRDLAFDDVYLEDTEYRVLREMARRGVPVHIYPLTPATSQLFASLDGTLVGDGGTGLYTAGWHASADATSRAFLIVPDDADGGYAEEFDPDDPQFVSEARLTAATEGIPGMERGLYLFRGYENLVPNALLGNVVSDVPDGWTASGLGTAGVNYGVLAEGCIWNTDLPALWAQGTPGGTGEFRSGIFSLPASDEAYWMASFLCQSSAGNTRLYIEWLTSAGGLVQRDEIVRAGGSRTAWLSGKATRPGATSVKAQFCIRHMGGYGRYSLPQFADVNIGSNWNDSLYCRPIFIGSALAATTARIEPARLRFEGSFLPRKAVAMHAGIVTVPMSLAEMAGVSSYEVESPLMALESTAEGYETFLTLRAKAGSLQLCIGHNTSGTHVVGDSENIASHVAGDRYAWVMCADGTKIYGYIRRLGDSVTYSVDVASVYCHGDSLTVGSLSPLLSALKAMTSDCIHNAVVSASVATVAEAEDYMELLADPAFLELLSCTSGRMYHLRVDMSKDPYDTLYYSGSIDAFEQDRT